MIGSLAAEKDAELGGRCKLEPHPWNRILSCPREELLVLREAGLEEAQKGRVGMIQLTP